MPKKNSSLARGTPHFSSDRSPPYLIRSFRGLAAHHASVRPSSPSLLDRRASRTTRPSHSAFLSTLDPYGGDEQHRRRRPVRPSPRSESTYSADRSKEKGLGEINASPSYFKQKALVSLAGRTRLQGEGVLLAQRVRGCKLVDCHLEKQGESRITPAVVGAYFGPSVVSTTATAVRI